MCSVLLIVSVLIVCVCVLVEYLPVKWMWDSPIIVKRLDSLDANGSGESGEVWFVWSWKRNPKNNNEILSDYFTI